LIYKNPFSAQLERQQTIGLWDAVQFLNNEGHSIDPSFKKDLEWLKGLRNSIEHHRFEMDLAEVRSTLGRLTQALLEFNSLVADFDITKHVAPENLELFTILSDAYKAEVAAAAKRAEEESEDEEAALCHDCFHETAARIGAEYKCFYCEYVDSLEECCVCGCEERRSTMSVWNEHGDYICESCEDRISSM
jgi:hypothetical protein